MLCHKSLFIFYLCPHVTFYKTLTSLYTVVIKGHVRFLQLLKWRCHTSFLALLDFVRATVMAQASVVRPDVRASSVRPSVVRPSVHKLKFIRNRCMNQDQILWEATYPPYLQIMFCVFKIFDFQIFTIFSSYSI